MEKPCLYERIKTEVLKGKPHSTWFYLYFANRDQKVYVPMILRELSEAGLCRIEGESVIPITQEGK